MSPDQEETNCVPFLTLLRHKRIASQPLPKNVGFTDVTNFSNVLASCVGLFHLNGVFQLPSDRTWDSCSPLPALWCWTLGLGKSLLGLCQWYWNLSPPLYIGPSVCVCVCEWVCVCVRVRESMGVHVNMWKSVRAHLLSGSVIWRNRVILNEAKHIDHYNITCIALRFLLELLRSCKTVSAPQFVIAIKACKSISHKIWIEVNRWASAHRTESNDMTYYDWICSLYIMTMKT